MTFEFFRFPHTLHLTRLGTGTPRDDKVLSPAGAQALLAGDVVIEEKLDGANLGFSLGPEGDLRAQNRGQYLIEPYTGQFARLPAWLTQHGEALRAALPPDLILFGEWCAARHSLDYATLPDWWLLFDVYDRAAGQFWSTVRRNALGAAAGFATVPTLAAGPTSVRALTQQVATLPSRYRPGPLEGLVIRQESALWCEARAKLVRADFTQAIETHWRRRVITWNRVSAPNASSWCTTHPL